MLLSINQILMQIHIDEGNDEDYIYIIYIIIQYIHTYIQKNRNGYIYIFVQHTV